MKADDTPKLITELHQLFVDALHEAQGQDAANTAFILCEKLVDRFKGELIYIPKMHALENSKRYQEIWEKFNGHNHRELCHEYDLTLKQVYLIIRVMREKYVAEHQRNLDEFLNPG